MNEFKDLFSEQAVRYSKFRPAYPDELFRYLASLTKARKLAWDCGTGNGQAAVKLASYFERIVATDPSEEQLASAIRHPKVAYRKTSAGESGLGEMSVDLITAAQAFHWFQLEKFFEEVRRVSKIGGVLAVWCYNLAKITPEVDAVVRYLYKDVLGSYWEKERQLVEEGYKGIPFPFEEIAPPVFAITAQWSLDQMVGYLSTWSALQTFIKKKGSNPLESVYPELKQAWNNDSIRSVRWALAIRVGVVKRGVAQLG